MNLALESTLTLWLWILIYSRIGRVQTQSDEDPIELKVWDDEKLVGFVQLLEKIDKIFYVTTMVMGFTSQHEVMNMQDNV